MKKLNVFKRLPLVYTDSAGNVIKISRFFNPKWGAIRGIMLDKHTEIEIVNQHQMNHYNANRLILKSMDNEDYNLNLLRIYDLELYQKSLNKLNDTLSFLIDNGITADPIEASSPYWAQMATPPVGYMPCILIVDGKCEEKRYPPETCINVRFTHSH